MNFSAHPCNVLPWLNVWLAHTCNMSMFVFPYNPNLPTACWFWAKLGQQMTRLPCLFTCCAGCLKALFNNVSTVKKNLSCTTLHAVSVFGKMKPWKNCTSSHFLMIWNITVRYKFWRTYLFQDAYKHASIVSLFCKTPHESNVVLTDVWFYLSNLSSVNRF